MSDLTRMAVATVWLTISAVSIGYWTHSIAAGIFFIAAVQVAVIVRRA
jgi:uncharacterized membrane protein